MQGADAYLASSGNCIALAQGDCYPPCSPDASRLEIRTDRQCLTLRRIPKPAWAQAMGRDRYGLWADFAIAGKRPEPLV